MKAMMKETACVLLLFGLMCRLSAASDPPPPPKLVFAFEVRADVGAAQEAGATAHGARRIIPITGGTFEGPDMKGQVLAGGADWQIVHADGMIEIEAHYLLRTDQGGLITVVNKGMRVASPEVAAKMAKGEPVAPSEYYFRASPVFETAVPSLKWLERSMFVCAAERTPTQAILRFYRVL